MATVNMPNSNTVNNVRSTFLPNHVDISLTRKEADFLYNHIESDLAIHPLGNFTTNSDLSTYTLLTTANTLKWKMTPTASDIDDVKIPKLDDNVCPAEGFVHSKLCKDSCLEPCDKNYVNSSDIQDEMTHWSICSPAPLYPSANDNAHFVYKAKTYGENTKIQHNLQHSETPQPLITRETDQYLSTLFFETFDT